MEQFAWTTVVVAAVALACAGLAWVERLRWRRQGVRSTFEAIARELGMDPSRMRHTAGGGIRTDDLGRTWGTATFSLPEDEYEMYRTDLRDPSGNLVNAWTKGRHLHIMVRGIPETIANRLPGQPLSVLIGPETKTDGLRIVEATTDNDGFVKVTATHA